MTEELVFEEGSFLDKLFSKPLSEMKMESYEENKLTPENMSYWLKPILNSDTIGDSILIVPETKIIMLDFENWDILTSDGGNESEIDKLGEYLRSELGDFQKGRDVFLKTGIFSNKFEFDGTVCGPERNDLGRKLYTMYYMSMMVGAYYTTEAVFREFIVSKESVPSIYKGMPLHTEFRVFYDFDEKEAVGISNYWHPDIMTKENLRDDYDNYLLVKDKIVNEYEINKKYIVEQVSRFMRGVKGLKGKWSIDVMMDGEDYWLIDMARMDRSSLLDVMETI